MRSRSVNKFSIIQEMKRQITVLLVSLLFSVFGWAQSSMTDTEVINYAINQKSAGMSEPEIAAELLKRGASPDQLRKLKQKYGSLSEADISGNDGNAGGNTEVSRMRKNNEEFKALPDDNLPMEEVKKVFGRDIFNKKLLSFEPQMNIATPQDYVVGPGDVLIIDVYGITQETIQLMVSPDGDVVVPDVGPIQVVGLTVAAAQKRISQQMERFYAESEIKVTIGQIRTIIVNVMGEVKVAGTYTLSAFSTVFHALYMAGGISELGTLRNIKVFRDGAQISKIDIYDFILNGRLAGNVRLQDNDVI
ncbi:MAG: polysaccharide export protein, partial [Bacteroidales bacterium]|nr:polysaccharide export protein [Bacteroidales bacterium]